MMKDHEYVHQILKARIKHVRRSYIYYLVRTGPEKIIYGQTFRMNRYRGFYFYIAVYVSGKLDLTFWKPPSKEKTTISFSDIVNLDSKKVTEELLVYMVMQI